MNGHLLHTTSYYIYIYIYILDADADAYILILVYITSSTVIGNEVFPHTVKHCLEMYRTVSECLYHSTFDISRFDIATEDECH